MSNTTIVTQSGVEDSLSLRKRESERTRVELARLRSVLPSDYISGQEGPVYTQFLRLFAEEYARLRTMMNQVGSDGVYSETRLEYLYQILGHRLHDLDERTRFIPNVDYDSVYQDFVLGILASALAGSTPASLEAAAQVATQRTGYLQELFRFLPPYQTTGPFDPWDRNFWKFVLTVPISASIDYEQLYQALLFVGRLLKPSHTNFDPGVTILVPVDPFLRGIGKGACCVDFETTTHDIFRSYSIIKSREKEENEAFVGCIADSYHLRGRVTDTYIASGAIPGQPDVLGYVEVEGIKVTVLSSTTFTDIDSLYTSVADLQVGDIVEVEGRAFDFPVTDGIFRPSFTTSTLWPITPGNGGFSTGDKIYESAVCLRPKWMLEQYRYRDYKECRVNQAECTEVTGEEVNWLNFPTRQEFYIPNVPLATLDENCYICYQWDDVDSPVVVEVFHDAGGGPVQQVVESVDPYTGRVYLTAPVPAGTTTYNYKYWKNQPLVGLVSDADGLRSDMDRLGESHFVYSDLPTFCDPYSAPDCNVVADWFDMTTPYGSAPRNFAYPIFCQEPAFEEEPTFHVRYRGLLYSHSSLLDTYNMVSDRTDVTYRHRSDDYNVIDSRGWDILANEDVLPQYILESLLLQQEHLFGTVLVPWTQDFINGVNRVFKQHIFVPSFNTLLNYAESLLNEEGSEINQGVWEVLYEYVQDIYTCLVAQTYITQNQGCQLRPKARASIHNITIQFF